MKTTFEIIAISILLSISAFARVGESRKEIASRYGDAKKSGDRLKATGVETWKYSKSGFTIEVVFFGDRSIWEIIQRQDKEITDEDINALLKLYDSSSTNWRFDRRESRWERGGKPELAAYRWPGHPDFFCIKDVEVCETLEKGGKVEASGL